MFKKLRNRFLILNLVVISVMMLVSFTSIYLMSYKNDQFRIKVDLHEFEEYYFNENEAEDDVLPPYTRHSVSFAIGTDNHWNIITKSSLFDIDNDLYENAKKAAISQNKNTGKFFIDGEYWSFMITSVSDDYRIVFLNTTSQQIFITNLIYASLFVSFIMLIFIYFISKFFANRSIKPIKEAYGKQKQFIADVSHELKTPLAVINTNVDALLSNGEDTINNQAKWLNYIKSESERMTKLTNDLLYLTKVDYSDIEMSYTKFNMSEAVEYVILTMEALIYEHNISLNYDIAPELITYGNDEQIRQVAMILLNNAVKYTNSSGNISISLKKRNNDIVLSITNTGDGIPKEHLEKIFDRFYRIDKSRSHKLGGYGLGLSIAKTIIDQHKGKIHVESKLNESTTFFITLRLYSE